MEAEFKNRKRPHNKQVFKGYKGYTCRSLGAAMGQGETLSISTGDHDMGKAMHQSKHGGYQGVEALPGKMHQGAGTNHRKIGKHVRGAKGF